MTNAPSPIEHATSTHLSSEDDDPRQARAELLKLVQQFNALLDSLGSAAFKDTGINEGEIVALTQGGLLPQSLQPSTSSLPTGTLLDFFRNTPPTGWLEANGQSINNQNSDHRELFSLLFHLASESGSSLTNLFVSEQDEQAASDQSADSAWTNGISMKLPDLRGRTRIGVGQGTGLTARSFGSMLGLEEIVLEKSHLPNVQLTLKHPLYQPNVAKDSNFYFSYRSGSYKSFVDSSKIIDSRTEAMGNNTPHNNMQPGLVVLTCIKY